MNIIMENSNKQAPNFLTKKLINFGDTHKKQTDLYIANIKQDKFYKKDSFIIITWLLFYPLGIFLMYKYSLKLRKFRHLFNILPLIVIALANKTIAMILGLCIPFIFIPIFTISLFYCLVRKRYFMPSCAGIIASCIGFLVFTFFHI